MKFNKVLPWLPALLVLAGCPDPVKPPEDKRTLETVTVSCPPSVAAGGTVRCTASAKDNKNDDFAVSGYTWEALSSAATVDTAGNVTSAATSAGQSVTIRATAEADGIKKSGQAQVSITERPATVHSNPIITLETWGPANNPHVVRGQLVVDNGATLTIEAGADVRFEAGAELRVANGALLVPGSAAAPVFLTAPSAPTPGSWRGVVLATEGSASRLSHVTLRHCGKADAGEGACLAILNKAAPVLQDVTVQDSGSAGVKLAGEGSAFGAESARLKVTGSAGYAVRMSSNEAGTLPADSSFTGNVPNAIELQGDVTRTQTWLNPGAGVSYVLKGNVHVSADNPPRTLGADHKQTTLTLKAGTVLRFGAKTGLFVGYIGGDGAQLLAEGTATEPVLFTADADSPTPGFWAGVNLLGAWSATTPASRLAHVIIEFAGAQAEGGPPGPENEPFQTKGNLNLMYPAMLPPVITDLIVRQGSGPGIYMMGDARLDATSGRWQVRDNGQYGLLVDAVSAQLLPTDTVYSGNTPNVVALSGPVYRSATWPKLSVPYLIPGVVRIGEDPLAVLTVAAGTEMRFAKGAVLVIGHQSDGPGALVARGTAEAPIRFVPDKNPLNTEYWGGLHFWLAEGSALEHVIITDGGFDGWDRFSEGIYGSGNVNVLRELGPFITNSRFERGWGCDITVSRGTRPDTGAVTTNFFDPAYNNSHDESGNPQCQF